MARPTIRGNQIAAGQIGNSHLASDAAIASTKLAPWSADRDAGGNRLTNAADPAAASDVATKGYTDSVAQGLDVKASCRVATTGSLTVGMGGLSGAPVIDGVPTVPGDRILVKNQDGEPQYNGIYDVAAGPWSRAADSAGTLVSAGLFTFISSGTSQADTGWVLTTDDPIVVDTTPLAFAQFSGAGAIVAGAGLVQNGQNFDVVSANSAIKVNPNDIEMTVAGAALEIVPGGGLRVAPGQEGDVLMSQAGTVVLATAVNAVTVAEPFKVDSTGTVPGQGQVHISFSGTSGVLNHIGLVEARSLGDYPLNILGNWETNMLANWTQRGGSYSITSSPDVQLTNGSHAFTPGLDSWGPYGGINTHTTVYAKAAGTVAFELTAPALSQLMPALDYGVWLPYIINVNKGSNWPHNIRVEMRRADGVTWDAAYDGVCTPLIAAVWSGTAFQPPTGFSPGLTGIRFILDYYGSETHRIAEIGATSKHLVRHAYTTAWVGQQNNFSRGQIINVGTRDEPPLVLTAGGQDVFTVTADGTTTANGVMALNGGVEINGTVWNPNNLVAGEMIEISAPDATGQKTIRVSGTGTETVSFYGLVMPFSQIDGIPGAQSVRLFGHYETNCLVNWDRRGGTVNVTASPGMTVTRPEFLWTPTMPGHPTAGDMDDAGRSNLATSIVSPGGGGTVTFEFTGGTLSGNGLIQWFPFYYHRQNSAPDEIAVEVLTSTVPSYQTLYDGAYDPQLRAAWFHQNKDNVGGNLQGVRFTLRFNGAVTCSPHELGIYGKNYLHHGFTHPWLSAVNTFFHGQNVDQGLVTAGTQPALALRGTWDNAAATFHGLLVDVTNGNSAVTSRLADLQVNHDSQFSVDLTGTTIVRRLMAGNAGTAANLANLINQPEFYNNGVMTSGVGSRNKSMQVWMESANNFASGFHRNKRGATGDDTAAVVNTAELGYDNFNGWDGSAYGRGAYLAARANENWSGTAHGGKFQIAVTPKGSTTTDVVVEVVDGLVYNRVDGRNIPASPLVRKDNGDGLDQAFALLTGAEIVLTGTVTDLTSTGTQVISPPVPGASFHFFVNEVGWILSSFSSVSAQPTVSFGNGADTASLVAPVQTQDLAASWARERLTNLRTYNGQTSVAAAITVAATGTLSGRPYWKGILVQDP